VRLGWLWLHDLLGHDHAPPLPFRLTSVGWSYRGTP
jgi:hypothetical protein